LFILFLNQPLGNQKNALKSFAFGEREKIGSKKTLFSLRFSAGTDLLPTAGWCVTSKMPGL